VSYNILTEFGVPKKLVRLIKMCLNQTYSKVRVGKNPPYAFPVENGLKQGYCKEDLATFICTHMSTI